MSSALDKQVVDSLGDPEPSKKDHALAEVSAVADGFAEIAKAENPLQAITNSKHALFVERYAIHGNAARAAVEVGTPPEKAAMYGYKWLKIVKIKAAIDWIRATKSIENGATIEWIVRNLMSEAEYFGEGGSAASRIRALELLGKWQGMFKEEGLQITSSQPCKVFIGVDADRV